MQVYVPADFVIRFKPFLMQTTTTGLAAVPRRLSTALATVGLRRLGTGAMRAPGLRCLSPQAVSGQLASGGCTPTGLKMSWYASQPADDQHVWRRPVWSGCRLEGSVLSQKLLWQPFSTTACCIGKVCTGRKRRFESLSWAGVLRSGSTSCRVQDAQDFTPEASGWVDTHACCGGLVIPHALSQNLQPWCGHN